MNTTTLICAKPSVVYLPEKSIIDEIDANYWDTKYLLELDDKYDKLIKEGKIEIKENREIIEDLTDYTANGSFASLKKNVEIVENGIPFIRIKNLSENGLNLDDLKHISEKTYQYLKKSKLEGGELLYSKTGEKLGLAFVFPCNYKKASLADNTFKVLYKRGIDHHFISIFLNSKYGKLWTRRLSQGVAQPTIIKDRFRSILVPNPLPEVQRHIGDKVRRAEELRTETLLLKNECKELLSKYIGIPNITSKKKSIENINSEELYERIDADYYNKKYLEILQQLKSLNYPLFSINEICNSRIFNGKTFETSNIKTGYYNIGVGELGDWYPSKNNSKSLLEKPFSRLLLPKDAIVWGNAAHLAKYIGLKVNIIQEDYVFSGTTEITAIVPDRQKISPYYLFLFMNSEWGYHQIQRTVKGMTAHSYPEDIKNILVPFINFKPEEITYIDNSVRAAFQNETEAERLIMSAKQDVEDLIEGRFEMPKSSISQS